MQFVDIFLAQLIDPFRIGLLVVLVMTAVNTSAQTGFFLPLLLGAIFVAILIPTAMSDEAGSSKYSLIAVGLVSNAVILGVIIVLRMIAARLKASGPRS
jgi:hypothetical protein